MSKKISRKNALLIFLAAVCIVTLLVSLYFALRVYFPQRQEQKRFDELRQTVTQQKDNPDAEGNPQFAPLVDANSDFKGWLNVPDTQIDYPVLKASEDDPEYYLRRDFDKNYSFSGTPFIGGGCNADSDIFIIYGHNMKNGTMFTDLDKYSDAAWAASHQDFMFSTPSETRIYRVFSAFRTKVGSEDGYKYYDSLGNVTDERYDDYVRSALAWSQNDMGNRPTDREQILILSTCSYHTENGRFVVVAYRVK